MPVRQLGIAVELAGVALQLLRLVLSWSHHASVAIP